MTWRSPLVLLPVGALVVAGCTNGRHLDMTDLRKRLEADVRARMPDARLVEAECPPSSSVRVGKGVTFRCTVAVDGRRLLVTLTQTDDAGHTSTAIDG